MGNKVGLQTGKGPFLLLLSGVSDDLPPPSSTPLPAGNLCRKFVCILLFMILKAYVNPFELLESLCLLLVVKVPSDHRTTPPYGEREVLK